VERWREARGHGGDADLYTQPWKPVRRAHGQDLVAAGAVQRISKRTSRWAAHKGPQPLNKHAELKDRAQVELAAVAHGVHRQTGADCLVLMYDESRRKVSVMSSGRLGGLAKVTGLDAIVNNYVGLQRSLRALKGLREAPATQSSFAELHESLQRSCVKKLAGLFQPEGKRQQENSFLSGACQYTSACMCAATT